MAASPDPLSLSTPEDSKSATDKRELTLSPVDNARLSNLRGPFDNHLRAIELGLGVEIRNRGEQFLILGSTADVDHVEQILRSLYETTKAGLITPEKIHLALRETQSGIKNQPTDHERQYPDDDAPIVIRTNRGIIKGRSPQQRLYLKAIQLNDLSFGIGPAGTGKTFLAVASAVQALEQDRVRRLVLVRPAVEAGEKLGFLPGDMAQKIDPYLRPLYDALYEMLGFEKVARLTERSVIEVAPLAFMRGRTLNDSFVILDEAQNTTMEQMKMFLTRIGFGSVAVVTGDITQIDLPKNIRSGLQNAMHVLSGVPGISFTHFHHEDVVRHPLVQAIIRSYERFEQEVQHPQHSNK